MAICYCEIYFPSIHFLNIQFMGHRGAYLSCHGVRGAVPSGLVVTPLRSNHILICCM